MELSAILDAVEAKPVYRDGLVALYNADCLEAMAGFPEQIFAACITDPPYLLNFMGHAWDRSGVSFDPETWRGVLRILKPGASLMAFGGSRTWHRIACAIEDAGFALNDCLMWLFGQGFPKGIDLSKAIDRETGAERAVVGERPIAYSDSDCWGIPNNNTLGEPRENRVLGQDDRTRKASQTVTAPATEAAKLWSGYNSQLKPCYEPICWAVAPTRLTFAANALEHGVSGINVDGCRIPIRDSEVDSVIASQRRWNDTNERSAYGQFSGKPRPDRENSQGRWPTNVALDEEAAAMLDGEVGETRSSGICPPVITRKGGSIVYAEDFRGRERGERGYIDKGGPSRYFKTVPNDEDLFFDRAKAILGGWNEKLANTADDSSCLSREYAGSVLNRAVTEASQGATRLSVLTGLSTSVTPMLLRRLCESVTAKILSSGRKSRQESVHGGILRAGNNPAKCADLQRPTGTTTTTTRPLIFDGSAVVAILSTTSNSTEAGDLASPRNRWHYTAKASRRERGRGNTHPTIKPLALMQWLCRMLTYPADGGGVLLDPFAGSGTTLLAARLEGRPAIGIERDVKSCMIAISRLEERKKLWDVSAEEATA